ncbi:MAG: hypothetical protein ACM359_06045 [Bacillota bacterium]
MRPVSFLFLCLSLIWISSPAQAAVEMSLPLEGYYRPGRYMPVRVMAEQTSTLFLQGQGVIPTQINADQTRLDGIIPLFPLDNTLRLLHWTAGGTQGTLQSSLRALQPDQCLVGLVADDLPFARQLFPDKTVIPIRLDPATPLPGPIAAWQALDAVVLDQPMAQQLGQSKLAALLAGGTLIAVRGQGPPNSDWPWSSRGNYWILIPDLAGPQFAGVLPAAFVPVQGWRAEWPVAFRRRIVLSAVICSLLLLVLSLVRTRWTVLLLVLLSATVVLLLGLWWKNRSAVLLRDGQVIVLRDKLAQVDLWHYYASPSVTIAQVPWLDTTWPFFEDPADCDAMGLSLLCRADGQPLSFSGRIPPGLKIGFLSRSIGGAVPATSSPVSPSNPLVRLAKRAYLTEGDQIVGQLPSDSTGDSLLAEHWAALLIQRTSAP